jgi:hypothetical protein
VSAAAVRAEGDGEMPVRGTFDTPSDRDSVVAGLSSGGSVPGPVGRR